MSNVLSLARTYVKRAKCTSFEMESSSSVLVCRSMQNAVRSKITLWSLLQRELDPPLQHLKISSVMQDHRTMYSLFGWSSYQSACHKLHRIEVASKEDFRQADQNRVHDMYSDDETYGNRMSEQKLGSKKCDQIEQYLGLPQWPCGAWRSCRTSDVEMHI